MSVWSGSERVHADGESCVNHHQIIRHRGIKMKIACGQCDTRRQCLQSVYADRRSLKLDNGLILVTKPQLTVDVNTMGTLTASPHK